MRHGIRALVVDDSEINLIVAQELLRALSIEAELAGSGPTAVEMCKLRRYDIVLMDHLMPDMDGIEAAKLIQTIIDVPVVAMTANEDPDAQALFLANGFAGFLQKPVDVSQISDLLTRLLPKKRPNTGTAPNARTGEELYEENGGAEKRPAATLLEIAAETGLDVQKAVGKLGGVETAYVSILRLFAHTGPEKLESLQNMLSSWRWKDFLIAVHGQKSALANIGATALSEEARVIESAVKDSKHELVEAVFGGFYARYAALCKKLHVLWPEEEEGELRDAGEQDRDRLTEALQKVDTHLAGLEQEEALEAMVPLLGIRFGEPVDSGLAALKAAVSSYDYDKASEFIRRLSKGVSS